MERDPALFAWRAAPAHHAAAVGLSVGLGGPLAALALFCLRDLVDALTQDGTGKLAFLKLVLPLPEGFAERRLTLFDGVLLSPSDLQLAALGGIAGTAIAVAGLGWFVSLLCFEAQTRATLRLRAKAAEAILRSPAAAREDVRALPDLVGRALAAMGGIAAVGILLPAMSLAGLTLAVVLGELAAPRLVPVVLAALLAAGLARILVLRRAGARGALRRREAQAAEEGLGDLIRRMPAVRAHGAAAFERRRLGLRALADRATVERAEAGLAYARAPALALVVLLPAILVATALWREDASGQGEAVLPGELAAAAGAAAIAAALLALALRLWLARREAAPLLTAIARILDGLETRRLPMNGRRTAPFPKTGSLTATGVGAYDPGSGERLAGIDATLPMPAHVAIVGSRGGGARALAAVLAGQIEPTAGTVSYGGIDLRSLDPAERARRIAFAGQEAILIEGTLRQNLLYGARSGDREASGLADRIAILKLTGLDAFVYARGLEAPIDPEDEPAAAAAIVAARQAVRDRLEAEGMARLVEPFDPARYNRQANVGENILFGEALGPAFAQANLAAHPYLRAVLEAEGLTAPMAEIGLQVARSTVEIFADLPDDHPLFDAFSLFPAQERGFFEDLVARQPDARSWRRGPAGQRDRERLIGLALRYSETRHRFGLIDEALEERIVAARRSFAALLPPRFRAKVEFYDPARLTAAASLEDNLLFGRVTQGEAGAEQRVRALVRRVLAEQGLEPTVYRLGLATRVDPGATGTGPGGRASAGEGTLGPRERVAIDLVRCLVRRPDILVVGLSLDERNAEEIRDRIARLRALRAGLGLIVCLPDAASLEAGAPFDAVLRVERNALVPDAAEAAMAEAG
ncbi:ABC transporter ATP-binding protein [Methylobacterium organophilum]|uniref:ATP-binding cassette domain-containing protein n=1 Tax=Methylobacterium organophilum TaxID=410 RepID=UPI001F12DA87|nr:ATP-binding cassette domain-containing protein [Methylobacterium organophilum]UMY17167.1 ABC transporter ATP-binding protein [Methylobacterium organophilum]